MAGFISIHCPLTLSFRSRYFSKNFLSPVLQLVLQPHRIPGNSVLYFEVNVQLQINFIARFEVFLEVLLKTVLTFT